MRLTAFVSLLLTASPAMARPNILFLFGDDHRADAIGAAGNKFIRTPAIDRLYRAGYRFDRAYCMGSTQGAVCQPSRAMLMSGRTLYRVPMLLEGVPTLGKVLGEAGYTTFGTGKWHNGPESFLATFQNGRSVFLGGMSDHTKMPIQDIGPDHKLTEKRVGEKFSSELFADAMIDFLRTQDGGKPFFAYAAFTAPHDPRMPPQSYRDYYYKRRPPLPANFLPQHPFNLGGSLTGRDENLAGWPRTKEAISDQLAEYYGLITHLDEQLGRVLAALEKSGQAKNTIIVYSADHGLAVGSHGLLGKQNLYEHSMRAPLVIAGPGIPRGRSAALVYLLDLFPTLTDLAGVQNPDGVEGKSLRPLWEGKAKRVRESLFTTYEKTIRAVRDDRWKLIRYPQVDTTQLFDLTADPDERQSLAQDPKQRTRVEAMMSSLATWQAEVGDKQPLTVQDPKPAKIDLTGHARTPDAQQPKWIVDKYF